MIYQFGTTVDVAVIATIATGGGALAIIGVGIGVGAAGAVAGQVVE